MWNNLAMIKLGEIREAIRARDEFLKRLYDDRVVGETMSKGCLMVSSSLSLWRLIAEDRIVDSDAFGWGNIPAQVM